MDPHEGVPLSGGNSGPVVRVGDTVRRVAGPWTPQVQRWMRRLRDAGVVCVPEPLGLDDRGREVVRYVPGQVPAYPVPDWAWSDDLLVDVASLLRRVHDATAGADLPRTGWRRDAVDPVEVVCHSDVAPYNTVCRDGRVVAFVDWDYAVPAPRGWDVGYAAYRWVTLTPPGHPDGRAQRLAEQRRRLALFCAAYGDVTPADTVRWATLRLDDLGALIRQRAAAGDPAFAAMLRAGDADLYQADAAWLRRTYLADR